MHRNATFELVGHFHNDASIEFQGFLGVAFVALICLMFMLAFMFRLCPADGRVEADSVWLAEAPDRRSNSRP
jgi:hypothetical protein